MTRISGWRGVLDFSLVVGLGVGRAGLWRGLAVLPGAIPSEFAVRLLNLT